MKISKILIILLILIGFGACEDIIEVDLNGFSVVLLAPANGTSTSESEQTFYWQSIKGAEEYNLQIASPGFLSVSKFVLDTTITENYFDFSLTSGNYEWRVKAINSSSKTDYSTAGLEIIKTTTDITSKKVILASPADKLVTKNTSLVFLWENVEGAFNYHIKIVKGTFDDPQELIKDTDISELNYTQTFTPGAYEWEVMAMNEISQTEYTKFSFTIEESTE